MYEDVANVTTVIFEMTSNLCSLSQSFCAQKMPMNASQDPEEVVLTAMINVALPVPIHMGHHEFQRRWILTFLQIVVVQITDYEFIRLAV